MAILATHLAACAAALAWMALEWARLGKPTSVGLVTGVVAGLATITPASGYVGPMGAIAIGLAGGALCFFATRYIKRGCASTTRSTCSRCTASAACSARCSQRFSPPPRSAASAMPPA